VFTRRDPSLGLTRQANPTWSAIPAAQPAVIDPGVALGLHLGTAERDNLGGLRRRRGGLDPLQHRDPINPYRIIDAVAAGGQAADPSQHLSQPAGDPITHDRLASAHVGQQRIETEIVDVEIVTTPIEIGTVEIPGKQISLQRLQLTHQQRHTGNAKAHH
jgi:hypothetical protein